MRSIEDDLTTRARIRDAALLLFGRHGFERTTIRAVGAEAGVSPALVMHHFGSKLALREACDALIVEEFVGRADEIRGGDVAAAMQRWLSDLDQFRPTIDYLGRILSERTATADQLFDALLQGTRTLLADQGAAGVVRTSSDPEVSAAIITAYGVVPIILARQLSRALGGDVLSDEGLRRLTVPILELYTHGLYTDETVLEAAKEALARTSGPASDKGANRPNADPDPPTGSATA